MNTTPARDCPDHNDPIECTCQAARGQADAERRRDRRKRYAAAVDGVTGGTCPTDILDAVMAVADQELAAADQEHERLTAELRTEVDIRGREIARLRKEAAEVRASALDDAANAATVARIPFLTSTGREQVTEWLRRMAAAARPDDTTGA